MMRAFLHGLLLFSCLSAAGGVARAEPCPSEQFAAAVDSAGASLRQFNGEAQPKLKEKLKTLQAKKGWSDDEYEEKGIEYLRDSRIEKLDEKANELLTKVDTLGRPDTTTASDCAQLAELKAAGSELLAVMKTKSAYLLERIDKEGALGPQAEPEPKAATAPDPKPSSATTPQREALVGPSDPSAAVSAWPPQPGTPRAGQPMPWDTTTRPSPTGPSAQAPGPSAQATLPPIEFTPDPIDDGYTIDEIKDATRGFFGTISTNLAGVIEHAFGQAGRPTAYVLGTEAGGALLAGVRYGSGKLFLRAGGSRKIWWHGPSLGYDLGAEGSRTLFLIYRLREPEGLFRTFTGVDGSAYLVGGVGMTLLKGGEVIMAPIRSGIGLRLGANLGYVRFTDHATWNPF